MDTAPVPEPTIDELNARRLLGTVYFEYDSDELGEVARSTLQDNARWLRENPTRAIRVEGHCDERGNEEYNLALGERRAHAVKEYLANLGVSSSQLRVVSYGEAKPAVMGHNESAWKYNRRTEFRTGR